MTPEERREWARRLGAEKCSEPFCDGRVRPVYRASSDGDVEPGGYCSRCGQEAY